MTADVAGRGQLYGKAFSRAATNDRKIKNEQECIKAILLSRGNQEPTPLAGVGQYQQRNTGPYGHFTRGTALQQ
jgi:hypothetical protein